MYLDTSYIAKFYFNEPESPEIREIVRNAEFLRSSIWAWAEFHAVLHRHLRQGALTQSEVREVSALFCEHTKDGMWNFAPITETLLRRTSARIIAAPFDLFIRTADAVPLTTAQEIGEPEVWTDSRQMLAAASYFGVTGRSVSYPDNS